MAILRKLQRPIPRVSDVTNPSEVITISRTKRQLVRSRTPRMIKYTLYGRVAQQHTDIADAIIKRNPNGG
jgi:hypothetical protein